jgi:hypothetical protein
MMTANLPQCALTLLVSFAPSTSPTSDEEYDVDAETCDLEDKACGNGVSCWGLYIACVGEWSCQDPQWWGCSSGTCVEPKRA